MNQSKLKSKYGKYLVDIKDFKIEYKIQSGGFGSIYSVRNNKTGEILAAKIVNMHKDEAQYKKMVNREIGIMIRCQHPTIIKFYGYSFKDFDNQNNVAIFMELAKKGSLAEFLQKVRKGLSDIIFDNTTRQIILIGISYGMMHLHQHRVIHRDLKPDNILLDDNFHPSITDFGLSKLIENGFLFSQTQQCGTYIYMAPEVLENNQYSEKSDVYSFGILMYEVITDLVPYPILESNKITTLKFANKVIYEDYRPEFNFPIKKSIQKIIERCWSKDPKERPTFEDLFKKLAYNIDDSIDDIYDISNAETENNSDDKYYLEDVDVDEVLLYADDLENSKQTEKDEISNKLREKIECMINPIIEDNAKLKEENEKMKKQMIAFQKENAELKEKIEYLYTYEISKLKDEQKKQIESQNKIIIQMKEEINKLKNEMIVKIDNEIKKVTFNLSQSTQNKDTEFVELEGSNKNNYVQSWEKKSDSSPRTDSSNSTPKKYSELVEHSSSNKNNYGQPWGKKSDSSSTDSTNSTPKKYSELVEHSSSNKNNYGQPWGKKSDFSSSNKSSLKPSTSSSIDANNSSTQNASNKFGSFNSSPSSNKSFSTSPKTTNQYASSSLKPSTSSSTGSNNSSAQNASNKFGSFNSSSSNKNSSTTLNSNNSFLSTPTSSSSQPTNATTSTTNPQPAQNQSNAWSSSINSAWGSGWGQKSGPFIGWGK